MSKLRERHCDVHAGHDGRHREGISTWPRHDDEEQHARVPEEECVSPMRGEALTRYRGADRV